MQRFLPYRPRTTSFSASLKLKRAGTRNPGWDRSDSSIDLTPALYKYREENGKFPQFEFSESSNVFDLYMPLGLGPEALSRLIYHDTGANMAAVDQDLIDQWCPLMAQVLSGGGWGLEPELVARIAPVMTEILLRNTEHQIELEHSISGHGTRA